MKRFLLTALGTNNNSTVCKYLKENCNNYVVGTDIYPENYIPSSKITDKFYQVSSVLNMDEYIKELYDICLKENIDYLLPVIDEEVYAISLNKVKFEDIGVKITCSNSKSIEICSNKLKCCKFLKENFPLVYIKTNILSENITGNYPLFIKPINGRASNNCFKINSKKELDLYQKVLSAEKYIIQEYIDGDFYTADFVNDNVNKKFYCLIRQELVRNKNGCGVVVKTVKNNSIEKLIKDIINKIGYTGIGNCEFVINKNRVYIIEINPRLSAGIDYSIKSGFDVIKAELNMIEEKEQDINTKFLYNKIFVRRYETYEM